MDVDRVFSLIVRSTCEVVPELKGYHFKSGDSLKALGANSVDRAEILMMTMEDLNLQIPLVEFADAKDIGALSELIHRKMS